VGAKPFDLGVFQRRCRPLPQSSRTSGWLERGSPGAVGLKGDPQSADTDGMKLWRRSVPALLLLVGVFAAPPASASMRSGADGHRCRTEHTRAHHNFPRILHFIVSSDGHRGAVGVWEHHSRDIRIRVRVEAGDRRASKSSELDNERAWDLVRCATLR
jgi:hypothetical protein